MCYFNLLLIDEKDPWSEASKKQFLLKLKDFTDLEFVRFTGISGDDETPSEKH